jgi:hypothetical protein
MNSPPPNIVSLEAHRRAQRALQFFAGLLGEGHLEDVGALGAPVSDLKHMPRLGMDIGVTRAAAPAHMRAALNFARRRQTGLILVRLRDPAPGFAEASLSVILIDGGAAVLELAPATSDGRRWWLVGPHPGDVHLRVGRDGLVPTLSEPWVEDEDRHSFTATADDILAEHIWRD